MTTTSIESMIHFCLTDLLDRQFESEKVFEWAGTHPAPLAIWLSLGLALRTLFQSEHLRIAR
jgi:hypothetical protein